MSRMVRVLILPALLAISACSQATDVHDIFDIQFNPGSSELIMQSKVDAVTVQEVKVNRGGCAIIMSQLRPQRDQQPPFDMAFGNTLHTVVMPPCQVIELEITTSLGVLTVSKQ